MLWISLTSKYGGQVPVFLFQPVCFYKKKNMLRSWFSSNFQANEGCFEDTEEASRE